MSSLILMMRVMAILRRVISATVMVPIVGGVITSFVGAIGLTAIFWALVA